MKKTVFAITCLAIATAQPIGAKEPGQAAPTRAKPVAGIDRTILHVQVILDKLNFAPGVIDGKGGQSLEAALGGFQSAHGLPVTGTIDAATLRALYPYRTWRPTRTLTLDAAILSGPFTNPLPKAPAEQARLPALGYRDAMEALAERFHTTPATLVALNSPGTRLVAGAQIVFPNVVPGNRDYATKDAAWRATLSSLNIDARQPIASRVLVSKSQGVLKVYDAQDRLVAQFPATMGSQHDPLPIGTWKIQGISTNPSFHYNPDLFWDAKATDRKATIPSGPNNSVGVAWIDLSKPHYGIHGTPEPSTIGRAESHGCIRLANWDVARLALMVKAGVPAVFEQ